MNRLFVAIPTKKGLSLSFQKWQICQNWQPIFDKIVNPYLTINPLAKNFWQIANLIKPTCQKMTTRSDPQTHLKPGQKTIIQVSFDERGTPFKRSPTHQKSVPPCSNANSHSRATNPRHTVTLLPARLIDGTPEGRIPRGVRPHDIGNVRPPRILLLRSPSTKHGARPCTKPWPQAWPSAHRRAPGDLEHPEYNSGRSSESWTVGTEWWSSWSARSDTCSHARSCWLLSRVR